jgi:hypothetical protein
MRTVFILAIIAVACICSNDDLGMEIEEGRCKSMASPSVSKSSQSSLRRPGDNQESVRGSTQEERNNRGNSFKNWIDMSLSDYEYDVFEKRFKSNEKGELEEIGKRFKKREEILGWIWLPGEEPLSSDRKKCLKESFCYIVLGSESFSCSQVPGRAYSTVALSAEDHAIDGEVKKALKVLQEIYKQLGPWDHDSPQDASGLLEGSQSNPQKAGDSQKSVDYELMNYRNKNGPDVEVQRTEKRANEEKEGSRRNRHKAGNNQKSVDDEWCYNEVRREDLEIMGNVKWRK